MSAFHGDLVVADIPALEAARTLTAADLLAGFEQLSAVAAELDLGELWQGATLVAADGSRHRGGPPGAQERGVMGVSMAWACLPGIGFEYDDRLVFEEPSTEGMRPLQLRIHQAGAAQRAAEIAKRAPLVDAVRRIAAAARGRLPFPAKAAVDVEASWGFELDVGYRKQLAYALGYEASITAETLAPYFDRAPALTGGSAAELAQALPSDGDASALSIALNLSAILEQGLAHEVAHGAPAPRLPDRIRDPDGKRLLLAERLQAAMDARAPAVTLDGRIALTALMAELRDVQRAARAFTGYPPCWGSQAGSESYRALEASVEE